MTEITCSTSSCIHNDNGKCEARTLYISSIEDGWPRCMDAIWIEDEKESKTPVFNIFPMKKETA